MSEMQQQTQNVMRALHKSVQDALDKKRRLGQYAVVWRDGQVVRLFDNEQSPKHEK